MHGSHGPAQAGFSLVEQVMVVALVAVLAGLALPPLGRLMADRRLQAAQFSYLAALRYARIAAIERNTPVLFCPSADGLGCGSHDDWARGWLLAVDRDRDGQPDAAPLRAGRVDRHTTVTGTAGRERVRFLPDGSAGGSNLSLLICTQGDRRRALRVVIANTGRIRGATASAGQAATCLAMAARPPAL